MIKQGIFFCVIVHKHLCYYSVVRQNVQLLIEKKDGYWVVDRAVVFAAGGGWFKSASLIRKNIYLIYFEF